MRPSGGAVTVCGAILAGGRAERFGGVAKGLLRVGAGTIIERELAAFAEAGVREVVISANHAEPYRRFGRQIVPDLRPGQGPLGGVEAVLTSLAGRAEAVAFLPCDLPCITAAQVRRLLSAFDAGRELVAVAVTDASSWQPLCAIVHNAALPAVRQALDGRERTVSRVWERLGPRLVHFDDAAPFRNVNTPQELALWRKEAQSMP